MSKTTKFLQTCRVFDTETTSLDFRDAEIIQLATADYQPGWAVTYDQFFKPSKPIPPEVSAITYITNRMVANSPSFAEKKNVVQDMLNDKPFLVAHNAFYDEKVLKAHNVLHSPIICTMRMAKKLYESDPTVTAYNLSYLRYALDLSIDDNMIAHRADDDSYVTAVLFEHLVDVAIEQWHIKPDGNIGQQLIDWLAEPIITHTMPFGKHKGQKMVDVPLSYWQWALENMDSLNEDKPEFDRDFSASVIHAVEKIFEKSA